MNDLWRNSIPGGSGYQEHTLSSPDYSKCSSSPLSFFSSCQDTDQEHETFSKSSRKKSNSLSSQSSSIFEFPSLDELRELGCDLLDGFWDEDQVQNTLNNSGCGSQSLNFRYDDTEDAYRPLQYPNHDEHAPTLTELNMEESSTFDSIFSLKAQSDVLSSSRPEVVNLDGSGSGNSSKPVLIPTEATPLKKRIEEVKQGQTGLSLSPTSWQTVRHSKGLSTAGLFLPAKDVIHDSNLVSAGSQNTTEKWRTIAKDTLPKETRVDFVNLFGRRSRKPPQNYRKSIKQNVTSPYLTKKLLEKELREKCSARTVEGPVKLENFNQGAKRQINLLSGFPNKHFHKDEEDEEEDADSHDEGLGSENEDDHHEDVPDDLISEDEDDEEVADDASDYSDDGGPSCSTDVVGRRLHFRSKRSEYDNFNPNPEKLLSIGKELQKLNKQIHDIKPPGDPSVSARNKTRREKNKLASRACRLKKKAQHEANKLKFHALEEEHDRLSSSLREVQGTLTILQSCSNVDQQRVIAQQIEQLIDKAIDERVAGQTDSYVNFILDQTAHKTKGGHSSKDS